jgi:starvation-inducible outer membrane lipoprotein
MSCWALTEISMLLTTCMAIMPSLKAHRADLMDSYVGAASVRKLAV